MCIIVIRFPYRSVILIHFYRRMVQPRQNSICKSFLQCVLTPVLLLLTFCPAYPFFTATYTSWFVYTLPIIC